MGAWNARLKIGQIPRNRKFVAVKPSSVAVPRAPTTLHPSKLSVIGSIGPSWRVLMLASS